MAVLFALALTLGGLALAVVGLKAWGGHRWKQALQALHSRLEAGRINPGRRCAGLPPTRYDARELNGLPAPVQRYFRAVLTEGQPIISAVSIDMTGSFNLSSTGEQWKPFTSHQRVVMSRPGFLWQARIAMLPGVSVRVVDSYIAGQGLLHATVEGLVTVAELQGDGEIARGEFMRWLAEVPWYPTALLPSQGVRWQAVDEHSALATVADGALGLTLLFRFDSAGLIRSFRADARGRLVGQQMVMAPWEGVWSNYQTRDGMRVPLTGEVAWVLPEGRRPYFVGKVTAMAFEPAR